MKIIDGIRVIDPEKTDMTSFKQHLADCVIITHDNKLLLQYRPLTWRTSPDCLNIFGGHVDDGETPIQAVIRELNEELGAKARLEDLMTIGSVTEACTGHTECVNIWFWHDKRNTITGCYEAEARRFNSVEAALAETKLADYARWAIHAAQDSGLLKPVGLTFCNKLPKPGQRR